MDLEDVFLVNKVDQENRVHFNSSIESSLRMKNMLLKSYPLLVFTANIPGRTTNTLPVAAMPSDKLWEIRGSSMIFGLSSTRKINLGIKSCNGSRIVVGDAIRIGKLTEEWGKTPPSDSVLDAFELFDGYYELSIPYGEIGEILNLIEIHNNKDDKIIIFANIYDPLESTARYYLNSVAENIFGESYSSFNSVNGLVASVTGDELLNSVASEAEKQALIKCQKNWVIHLHLPSHATT